MKCKHRDYQAKRRPRVNCEACWRKYIEKHPVKPEALIKKNDFWLSEDIRKTLSGQPLIPIEEWW